MDKEKSVVTPESGGPRDQSVPFYQADVPGGFIGWGKTTTLGASTGFAMGAKLDIIHVGGDYSTVLKGFGFKTEKIEDPEAIAPALQRAIETVKGGKSVFLECTTRIDTDFSI